MEAQRKVLKEIVLKNLAKEKNVKFSDSSIDKIFNLIDEYLDGKEKNIDTLVSKYSSSVNAKEILARGLEIYNEEAKN